MNTANPTLALSEAEPLSQQWSTRRRLFAGVLLLVVLTFGVYYPALRTQLVADDFYLVDQVSFPQAMTYFGKSFGFGRNEYRPLTALSFAVDRVLWHDRSTGYHLTNLLLHAATAGLFFLVLELLTGDLALSVLAGSLFVIHPINHPRVIWISARDGLVCGVFLLGALWLYLLSRRQDRVGLRVLTLLLGACALLSYEGAVILPGLIFAMDFIFLNAGPLRARIGSSLRRSASFFILTAGYLCLWRILFSKGIGGYDLSLTPFAILENYARLMATLLYGLRMGGFALVYLALIVLCYRPLRNRLGLTVFAAVLIVVSFIPYCFTHGFAYRFGYFSALGIAALFATGIVENLRSKKRFMQIAASCVATVLCVFYIVEDRNILAEWAAAGAICASIPQTVKREHPDLPEGAVLVFAGIPRKYGRANVFPTGLDAAIQREYAVKLNVRQSELHAADLQQEARKGAFLFQYVASNSELQEISADGTPGSPKP